MSFSYDKSNPLEQSMLLDDEYFDFEFNEEEQYNPDEKEFTETQNDEDSEEMIKEYGKYLFIIEVKRFKSSYDFLKYDGNYGHLLDLIDYFNYLIRNKKCIKEILDDIKYIAEMDENYDKTKFRRIVSLME